MTPADEIKKAESVVVSAALRWADAHERAGDEDEETVDRLDDLLIAALSLRESARAFVEDITEPSRTRRGRRDEREQGDSTQ